MRAFISYSRLNSSFAQRLFHDLSRVGIQPWLDVFSIPIGKDWNLEIRDAIAACDIFILLASPESAATTNVAAEVADAARLGRTVYCLWIAGSLSQLPPAWIGLQMIEVKSYWDALPRLCHQLGYPAPPDPATLLDTSPTLEQFAAELRGAKTFGSLVAAPVLPGPYGTGYLTGPPAATVPGPGASLLPPIALMIRFSGPEIDVTLTEAATFLRGRGQAPWILYVEGLLANGRFELPNGAPHIWNESAELCEKMARLWAKGRHSAVEVFLHGPNPLAFALGARLRELMPYSVFHYTRGNPLYEQVLQVASH